MTEPRSSQPPFGSLHDILQHHGLLVALGYVLSRATDALPSQLLFRIGICRWFRRFAAHPNGNAMPWWQDVVVIILLLLTGGLALGAYRSGVQSFWIRLLTWILIIDIVAYHARVLWFDDLQPRLSWNQLRVLSHRRILFQAGLNFVQSILLYGSLYTSSLGLPAPSAVPFEASLTLATTLSRPDGLRLPSCIVITQIGVSLFFLVVVIGIVASVGYARGEVAPRDPDS